MWITPARLRASQGTTPPRQSGTQQGTEGRQKEFQQIAKKLAGKSKLLISIEYFS
jgi:hypothetical protein